MSVSTIRPIALLFALAGLLVLASGVARAEIATLSGDSVPTIEELQRCIADLDARTELEPAVHDTAVELYRSTIAQIESAEQSRARTQEYQASIGSVSAQLATLRESLQQPLASAIADVEEHMPAGGAVVDWEAQLLQAQATESTLSSDLQRIENQLRLERERPNEIRNSLGELQARQNQLTAERSAPPSVDQPEAIRAAEKVLRAAQYAAVLAEQAMLEQESLSHDARVQLLAATLDKTRRELALSQSRRSILELRVADARRTAAVRAQDEATKIRLASVGKHPLVAALAEYNSRLGAELAATTASSDQLNEQLDQAKQSVAQIDHDFDVTRRRIEIAGLSEALGKALAEVRRRLPDSGRYEREVQKRQPVLKEIGLALIKVQERRRNLSEFESSLIARSAGKSNPQQIASMYDYLRNLEEGSFDGVLDDFDTLSQTQLKEIRTEFVNLRNDQQQLLDKLDTTYTENLRILSDVDHAQREVVERSQAFVKFIDRHLLWTPSNPPLSISTLNSIPGALRYLVSSENWNAVAQTLLDELHDLRRTPVRAVVIGLLVVLLVISRRRLRRLLTVLGRRNRYPYVEGYSVTLKALVVSALLTMIWPLVLGIVGQRLQSNPNGPEFVSALGYALVQAAWFFLFVFGFHVLCAKGGVALEQFKWTPSSVELLRRNLRWFLPVAVPCILVTATLSKQSDEQYVDGLGRIAYLLLVIALGVLVLRLFHPQTGLIAKRQARGDDSWMVRLRYLCYALLFGAPVVLVALSTLGYYYSAAVATKVVYATLWLLVVARILSDFIARWLIVNQRRHEWQSIQETGNRVGTPDNVGEGALATPNEDMGLDLQTINAQTRRLLNAALVIVVSIGLVIIWASVVPAFAILENVVLWQHTAAVGGVQTLLPVTLTDVALAIAISVVVVIAARNFPGLLEIVLLQRLPLDQGLRYAISSLCQYAIVTVGAVLVFNSVGVGWGQVQWLAAALTVGLGFGLQEIFANFVSGLIILFERPLRVGDTVTIGGITGTVTRIRTRATTITDWDNKEIVVPNKTFITDQLTNWSLSSPIVRVVIQVGIGYSSDTALAHRILTDCVQAHPLVLKEPAPSVYFMALGESSLNFDVRIYVKTLGDWLPVVHDFHMSIVKALAENGIEIPFPQRDLHIRSAEPLNVPKGEETPSKGSSTAVSSR